MLEAELTGHLIGEQRGFGHQQPDQVASGAAETVPQCQVTNLARTMGRLEDRGIWMIGLAGETCADLYATDLTGAKAWSWAARARGSAG